MKFAMNQQDFEGMDIAGVTAPEDLENVLTAFDQAAADGQIQYVTYALRDEIAIDSNLRYQAEITPLKNVANQIGYFIKCTISNEENAQ
jgi:hypothetical protein